MLLTPRQKPLVFMHLALFSCQMGLLTSHIGPRSGQPTVIGSSPPRRPLAATCKNIPDILLFLRTYSSVFEHIPVPPLDRLVKQLPPP